MLTRFKEIIISVFLIAMLPMTAWANEGVVFSSQATQVLLLEVYVSEGCSSCPPAQKWVSQFINDPRLWKEIVPIVFHVDYWDYLGWKDPFASKANTQRQYQYKTNGKINSVYTPGFVVNGSEWRGWFQQKELPANSSQTGKLIAQLESNQLTVNYEGKITDPILNIAILGIGIQVDVTSGENRNRVLNEDFVVLAHKIYRSNNGQWSVPLPKYSNKDGQRSAIALWVNREGDFTPIQATGGWLNKN